VLFCTVLEPGYLRNRTTKKLCVSGQGAESNITTKQEDGEYRTMSGLSNLHRIIFDQIRIRWVKHVQNMEYIPIYLKCHKALLAKTEGKRPPR
jgi:hypothetical protein